MNGQSRRSLVAVQTPSPQGLAQNTWQPSSSQSLLSPTTFLSLCIVILPAVPVTQVLGIEGQIKGFTT